VPKVGTNDFEAKKFKVIEELDAAKEFKLTTGEIDCLKKEDVEKLRKHAGTVRAYKVTKANGQGTVKGGITYEVGKDFEVKNAVTDEAQDCAAGINLADLNWVKKEYIGDYRIFACEFKAEDIAAIPKNTDGKFRVFRCKVVEELDLVELGLKTASIPPKPEEREPAVEVGGTSADETQNPKGTEVEPEKKGLFKKFLGLFGQGD